MLLHFLYETWILKFNTNAHYPASEEVFNLPADTYSEHQKLSHKALVTWNVKLPTEGVKAPTVYV